MVRLQESHEISNKYPRFSNTLHIPTPDYASPSEEQILAALKFIIANNGLNVLIHCKNGIGRSAVVAVTYVCVRNNLSLRKGYEFVYAKREISRLKFVNVLNPQWSILNDLLNRS